MGKSRNIGRHLIGLRLALAGFATVTTLLFGPVASAPAQAQVTTPSWTSTGNLNTARSGHTATLLANGKVLVVGGRSMATVTNSAELYDPATGTWSLTGSLNVPRYLCSATLLLNGKVLVAGGYSSTVPPNFGITNSAELYDPVTGTWSLTGNLSTTRAWHTATLLRNGKALVAGSWDGSKTVNTAELYDSDTGSWSGTGSLIAARYGQTATLLQDGTVLVAGGSDDGDLASTLASVELYDPATGNWKNSNSLGTNRILHTATLLPNGKALIAGGYGWPPTSFNSAELYDPAARTWTNVGNLIGAHSDHSATLLPNGKILVAGGLDWGQTSCLPSCQPRALSLAELSGPLVTTWSNTANLNIARFDHSSTLLPNGKVLVAGGFNYSNGILSSAELYNASADSVTNPIDDEQFFVRQHYLDFLSREPEQGGWDYWTNEIEQCGSDTRCIHQRRLGVSAAFFVELEFQETGYVVYRLHRAAYGEVLTLCKSGFDEEGNPCEPLSRANLAHSQFVTDRAQLVGGPGLPQSTINFANNFVQRPGSGRSIQKR